MSYKTQYEQTYQSLKNAHEQLNRKLSRYDLYESDLLHYIENEKYNAAMGSKLLKKLKENRQARRAIKTQLEEVHRMIQFFDDFNKKNKPSVKYHYRIASKQNILDVDLNNEPSKDE